MKKLVLFAVVGIVLASCSSRTGHLTGTLGRPVYHPQIPLGMVYIPAGGYQMGENDGDMPFLHQTRARTVSVQAFYMDQTEISNNEYRQFVYYVRDSIAHMILGEEVSEEHLNTVNLYGEDLDPPLINWRTRIDWMNDEEREALEVMFYPEHERFYRRKEMD